MRKISVITTSRAEYGLLYWLMKGIAEDPDLQLQLIVTGTHLSAEFGSTIDQIREDGFQVDRSFDLRMHNDSPSGISHSLAIAIDGFSTAFSTLKPDIVVILGDRFEILGASITALIANIPIAHIHGGELTMGAIDDSIRHSVTKMASLHFVAAAEYRKRVIQMGEHPSRVFNVGGMGLDNIRKIKLLGKKELEEQLGVRFRKNNYLITFHPETRSPEITETHFTEMLSALEKDMGTLNIFTFPNADRGSQSIIAKLEKHVANHQDNCVLFKSLGQLKYLSLLKNVDAVVGNSSSGIIEAPSFKVPTINIGNRQEGRIRADSVIDCDAESSSISKALEKIKSASFRAKLSNVKNPYGNGGAASRVLKKLKDIDLEDIRYKKFYELK
jgi:GDP/UDP-N,N'-diacetylbacillosamine 2-epimerase (hydrolysing)